MAFRYSVSLQIRHPDADPREIVRRMGRPALRSWACGDPRTTPKGTALDGTCRETYCVFDIGSGEDGELAACLRRAIAELESARSLFDGLRATGGSVSFYVSWTTGQRGETFDAALLHDMANLGIDLGIDPLAGD